jgi:hypothetical protein
VWWRRCESLPVERVGTANQLNLVKKLEGKGKSWEEVEKAMEVIKEKFGKDAIKRGGPRSAEPPMGE